LITKPTTDTPILEEAGYLKVLAFMAVRIMNITTRAANVALHLLATAVVLGLQKTNAEGFLHL
jgi:hypothetical protein